MNISFIPYKQITIKSPLSRDEILNAVRELTVPIKQEFTLFYFDNDILSQYKGEVKKNGFKLRRVAKHNEEFGYPTILGTLRSKDNQTLIDIIYRVQYDQLILHSIWMLFALYGFLDALISELSQDHFDFRVLSISIFLILGYLMIVIPFNVTCKKPTIDFLQVFKGELVEEE